MLYTGIEVKSNATTINSGEDGTALYVFLKDRHDSQLSNDPGVVNCAGLLYNG